MKICFIINELSPKHGWGRYALDLIGALSNKGVSVKALTKKNAQNKPVDFLVEKVLPEEFSFGRNNLFAFWQARKLFKYTKDCDLIHCLAEPYAYLTLKLSRQRPFFITGHGTQIMTPFHSWRLRGYHKKSLRQANKVFCVSNFTSQALSRRIKLDNVAVVNNGINFDKFQRPSIEARAEKIILSVGALKQRKGYHIAIPAAAEAKKKYPALRYYIVGDQSDKKYFKKLKDLVHKYDLITNVVFLQNISDKELINLYYQSDVFVLTPVNNNDNFEGFGLVYLEANACAKPVIGTYDCGAEEAIKNGYNGFLVPQNNIKETGEAILKLLENPDLSAQLGKDGLVWAKEHDWGLVAEKYLSVYGIR